MNRTTRNAIATAIKPYTGYGKTRYDYSAIINVLRFHGFEVTKKVSDFYTEDMTTKYSAYEIEKDGQEVNSLLVIDEYFGNPQATANGTHEINAYVS